MDKKITNGFSLNYLNFISENYEINKKTMKNVEI